MKIHPTVGQGYSTTYENCQKCRVEEFTWLTTSKH